MFYKLFVCVFFFLAINKDDDTFLNEFSDVTLKLVTWTSIDQQ